jgi:hypothetical protein
VLAASSSSLYSTADDLLIGSVHLSLADIMAVRKSVSLAGSALAALFDPLVHSSNDASVTGAAGCTGSVPASLPERPSIAKSRTQRLGSMLRGASHSSKQRSDGASSSSKSYGSSSSSGDAAAAAAGASSTSSSARSTLRRAPSVAAAAFASAGRRGSAMLSPHQLAAGCWYKFDCALVKNGRVTGRVQASYSLCNTMPLTDTTSSSMRSLSYTGSGSGDSSSGNAMRMQGVSACTVGLELFYSGR